MFPGFVAAAEWRLRVELSKKLGVRVPGEFEKCYSMLL
jgi:hypothetical protein